MVITEPEMDMRPILVDIKQITTQKPLSSHADKQF